MSDREKLQALLDYVRQDARVCPMPVQWNELWNRLRRPRFRGEGPEPDKPFVLSGWYVENERKQARLAYHIQWAFDHGALAVADRYLRSLSIEEWHHSDPSKPHM